MCLLILGQLLIGPASNAQAASSTTGPAETKYADRTDSVEHKLKQLEQAWKRKDYVLARALAASLRETLQFEQQESTSIGEVAIPATFSRPVSNLPQAWQSWAGGWAWFSAFQLRETVGERRSGEPVELVISVPSERVASLQREARVARIAAGRLIEVRSQITEEIRRGSERQARLTFFADSAPSATTTYLLFHGNPDAELPGYATDLQVRGEGYGLDLENEFYRASLSRQMGQLERLVYKREHGQELFAGGEGHGEPAGIDWAHDYVTSGNFQKLRITNWPECPDYEIIQGPLSLTVRRWGFPYSPVHPVFTPTRMNIFVEYRFYAGLPWFIKTGYMQVIQDVEIGYLRDDEWVFSGMSFNDSLWLDRSGKLHTGPVPSDQAEDLWGVGFYHNATRDAFIGLFLEHSAENAPPLKHTGSPTLHYRWHGHVWSRALYNNTTLKAGAVLRQKNAYLTSPLAMEGGLSKVESLNRQLKNPLQVQPLRLDAGTPASADGQPGQLARPGEKDEGPVTKKAVWEALKNCRDEQLYATRHSVVDLGLIRDVRIRAGVVHVVMAMPGRGRPRIGFYSYGSGGNENPIRELLLRIPGVEKVVVEQTWDSPWNSNHLTDQGRRLLDLP